MGRHPVSSCLSKTTRAFHEDAASLCPITWWQLTAAGVVLKKSRMI
jgi:hypothetical protein